MPALEPREQDQHLLEPPQLQKALPAEASDSKVGRGGGTIRKGGLVLILLLAAGLGYWKLKENQQEAADTSSKAAMAANRAIPITAAPVVARTMPIYLNALGTVIAYNTVTIKSRVDGQLLSVNVREGQQVKRGQELARIDPRPYEAVLAQAQGQLAKDQATAANANAEAGRYTALFNAGVISRESQQAQITSAGQAGGTIQSDEAAIQSARVNLGYTRITSPIDGVVGLRQQDAGNIIKASDTNGLLVITQLQPIGVIFTLPEDQLPKVLQLIRGGHKLIVDAYDRLETTKLASGTLLTLDNTIDTTTGTVKAKAVFDNRDGALFPNQFVNVRLILEQRPNSLVIPSSALQTGSTGTYVYAVKACPATGCPAGAPGSGANGPGGNGAGAGGGRSGGRTRNGAGGAKPVADQTPNPAGGGADAARNGAQYYVQIQPVVVDLTEGSQIILKSGAEAGDEVVVDGQEKLKPYSRVDPRPVRQSGPGGAAPGAPGTAPSTPGAGAGRDGAAAPDSGQGGLKDPAAGPRRGGPAPRRPGGPAGNP